MPEFKKGQRVRMTDNTIAYIQSVAIQPVGIGGASVLYQIIREDDLHAHIITVSEADIAELKPYANSIEKITAITDRVRTTGVWYSWGPSNYNDLWMTACTEQHVLEHAMNIPKAHDNLVGPGLYVANAFWRSSTYAQEGANLLIVKLNNVPTFDIRNLSQKSSLEADTPALSLDDLKHLTIADTTKYFYIYATNGNYGCLTASSNISLSTDLGTIPAELLLADAKKCGAVAKGPLLAQAKNSATLEESTYEQLVEILKE